MGFLKFLRGRLSQIPEEIVDGQVYLAKNTKGVYVDVGTERLRLNPPADWNETSTGNPAFIANKPEIGTVASHNIAEELSQTQDIPTSKQVYNAIRDLRAEFSNAIKVESPYVAHGVTEMTDHDKPYVYVGTESGMNTGHWYWYDGENWQDGGVYNAVAVDTDTTLTLGGVPADAAATGNFINELKGETEDIYSKINSLTNDVNSLSVRADSFFNELDVTSEGLVWGAQDGTRINGPYGPFAGNGGGGGGGGSVSIDAVFSATNTTEWNSATISSGEDLLFTFTWESIENDAPSGRGTVTITVNNIVKGTISVPQGENTINLKQYYGTGANKIRIRISDQYDQSKQWIINIEVVQLVLSSSFDASFAFEDQITIPYTPTGNVSKTIYFLVDDQVVGTNITSVSGKQLTYTLPAQSHGAHTLDMYFTAEINGETVQSNTLHYEFIAIRSGETEAIIISPFNSPNQTQYSSVIIPYKVYDPVNVNPEVRIYSNGTLISTQTINQQWQSYTYKANFPGNVVIRIESGNAEPKIIELTVTESEVHVEAETEGLELYLNAVGRNNNEETRNVWEYGEIQAQMTNFGWKSLDGWINDEDGITTLRTVGDARVYIPYKPFIRNFVDTGKTIEIEFATRNVVDYNAVIISCMHDGVGFQITPQTITFNSTQVQLMTPFKDNEHIRVSVVVHSQSNNRLILFYINGVMSSAVQYPSDDTFSQGTGAVGITIGSNSCGVDIYNIRVYGQDLNKEQIINNWVADTEIGDLMMDRYQRNNIFDNGVINPNTLPSNLPYWIINASQLPQYKDDKKTVTLSYTDPVTPAKSFTAEGVQINVQGTSSQAYYRKNYDLQFKKGFNLASGYSDNYTIIDAIPFNRFVLKADVASSESTNNTKLTMFYNDLCPYKVPEMIQNSKIRWGIEGKPCVVFWYNPDNGTTEFLGKFNFNLPKRCPEPLGYSGNDESWEVERNNSANVQFQDTDFTTQIWDDDKKKYKPEWYDDWEARFPEDKWREIGKLNEFVSWVKSTWTDEATNANLDSPVTYTLNTIATLTNYGSDASYTVTEVTSGNSTNYEITFTKDTPAYRLTKFRAEAPQYMEIESATFYYLFTHFFLMIDSRAKNMFMGFHGGETTGLQYMNRKVVFEPYDMDTGLGTNNSGVLKFGYYHLDTDTVSNIISGGDNSSSGQEAPVFNAQGSVLWNNFREAFRAEYTAMYRSLRSGDDSIFNYDYIENMYEQHQALWPEALFNEDAYVKYLVPLVEEVTYDEDTKKYIKTDRYLTMLQGSKEQQRKWWLQNRFRYFDSMFTVGSAETSFIEMRLFNSGTLTVTPSQDLYVAVRFGRGSTTQRVRTTAGTPVSFQYTVRSGMTVTEMESTIFSANLISDVGDLSVFYGNEFDFSKATRLRRLKLGDQSSSYDNTNLTKLNVNNCYLLEEIDCRNCSALTQPIELNGSPMLERVYFDGTSVTSVSFVPGAPLTNVHLPGTITSLVLVDHTNLTDFQCPSFANVGTLMLENINQSIVDPIQVLPLIKPSARINIQGFQLEVTPQSEDMVVQVPVYDENDNITGYESVTLTTKAEKAGYEIEQFLSTMSKMSGVQREWDSTDEVWDYHDVGTPIVSGVIHTEELTGTQIATYNAAYPYLAIDADSVESKRYYMSQDGQTQLGMVYCLNGQMKTGETPPSTVTPGQNTVYNYNGDKYTYTFAGWNTLKEKEVTNVNNNDQSDAFKADHYFYAVFTKVIRQYTVTWKNEDGTTLTGFTNPQTYNYGDTPVYPGSSMPTKQVNGVTVPATAWSPSISMVTQNTIYTAVYKPVYTATFVNNDGATLYSHQFIEDETPVYAGVNPPVNTNQENVGEFTFTGWSPAIGPIKANTTYTAQYQDNRSLTVQYLTGALTSYETASTGSIREYAFYNMTSLKKVDLTSTSAVTIRANAFNGCANLDSLIVRSTTMSTLSATSALNSTKIANYDGAVYVDSSALSSYTGNSSWKNYLITSTADYPASNTKLFELYDAKFSTTTDSWEDIATNENYATDYTVGTTKKVVDGGIFGPITMQLVAMGQDVKADGSGDKARMTWISQDLIAQHVMNANGTTTRTGKYGDGEGGWAGSEMREWLIDDVLPQINFHASSDAFAPVPVTKTQSIYTNNDIQIDGQTTTDSIWIPSHHEIFGTTSYESNEVAIYTGWFNSTTNRGKKYNNINSYWWLRSADGSAYFRCVNGGGAWGFNGASSTYGVALGFCL